MQWISHKTNIWAWPLMMVLAVSLVMMPFATISQAQEDDETVPPSVVVPGLPDEGLPPQYEDLTGTSPSPSPSPDPGTNPSPGPGQSPNPIPNPSPSQAQPAQTANVEMVVKTADMQVIANKASIVLDTAALLTALQGSGTGEGDDLVKPTGVTVDIPSVEGVTSYTTILPLSVLKAQNQPQRLAIRTGVGTLEMDTDMLNTLQEGDDTQRQVSLGISLADPQTLDPVTREKTAGRPVLNLSLSLDGKPVKYHNPDSPVTVRIPYEPNEEERQDLERITVWYQDGEGNLFSVPDGRYDSATGMVVFSTTHFSLYAVVYAPITYQDVPTQAWFEHPVGVLAARGVFGEPTTSTRLGSFKPDRAITRAEYLHWLVRGLRLSTSVVADPFDDVADIRTEAASIDMARALGVTRGTGNNTFLPDETITRQDMMVLTWRALALSNQQEVGTILEKAPVFEDASELAHYAEDAVAFMTSRGFVMGNRQHLRPKDTTSRAEAAMVLYRLITK